MTPLTRKFGLAAAALTAASLCACGASNGARNSGNLAREDAAQCTIAGLDLAVRGLKFTPGTTDPLAGGPAASVTGPSAADYGLDCMKRLGYSCTDAGACNGHGSVVKMSDYFGY
jgi:hypothetical protein